MKALLTLLLLGCMAVCSHAQCSMGTSSTWQDQFYDTDPNSLNGGTPVGFATLTFPGTDDPNYRAPCIQVNFPAEADSMIRYIYILVEAPDTSICVALENQQEPSCGTTQFAHCVSNVESSLRVEFSCTDSCEQNSFPVYYRIVREWREVDDEMFCDNLNETYPSSLQVVPTRPVDPNPMTEPPSGASVISSLLLQALLLISLLSVLLM